MQLQSRKDYVVKIFGFCPHNRQLPFSPIVSSIMGYKISYDLQRARQKALYGCFFMPKRTTSHNEKKSFLSIYHIEHINSRSVVIVAAGNSIMC